MSVLMLYCPFSGTLFEGDRTHSTYNGRLLVVNPDMADLLAVVTLRETSLGFVSLYPDCNLAKARHFECLLGL
jgi:hypothetical protein